MAVERRTFTKEALSRNEAGRSGASLIGVSPIPEMGENAPEQVQEALEVLSRAFEGIVKGEGVRVLLSGPLSGLPSPGVAGRYYLASAEGVLLEDRGADWAVVATKDWGRLINKPDTFPPSPHVHDDRYFTETEADARFVNESDHTKAAHDALNINAAALGGQALSALQLRSEKGQANGYASLDANSQVPEAQIPAVAITDTFEVSSQAAMLALNAQRGDVAVRSDINKSFVLRATPASTLSNWSELRTPTDAVLSVNGRTGAVSGLVETTDSRLSDQRAPTDGSVTAAKMAADNKGVVICTSTTRPANPVEGQHIYETDTDATLKNTGTAQSPVWSALGGAAASGPPEGFVAGAGYSWDSATGYRVRPGKALVNGALLSWSADIVRSALAAFAANSVVYVYLFDSGGGTAALAESATAPVYDFALGYWKLGGGAPDATRRCIGFLRTDANGNLHRFLVGGTGREREYTLLMPNATLLDPVSVLSGGTSTVAWTALALGAFLPAHASHAYTAAKVAFAAAGDDAIVGVSPVDLGTSQASLGPYTVRDSSPKVSTKTFFGRAWLPVSEAQRLYYRLLVLAGSPTAEVECHGARFPV